MVLKAHAARRCGRKALAATAAMVLALLSSQGCGEPEAPPIVFESTARSITLASARDPAPIVRASGAIAALVVETSPGGGGDLALHRSSNGDVYRRTVPVSAEPGEVRSHGEGAPRLLATRGGKFYAVWLARSSGPGNALRVARSDDFLGSFRKPVTLDTGRGPGPSFFTVEAAPDGRLIAAWLGRGAGETRPGTMQLLVSSSTDRGASFSAPVVVQSNVCPCCRPSIAIDPSGAWYLAWRDTASDHTRNIVVARSEDQGSTWSEPVQVPGAPWRIEGCPHSGPAMLAKNGVLWIAWYTEGSGAGQVFAARSTDGGRAYSAPIDLGQGVADPNHPVLARAGGHTFAAIQGRGADEKGGFGITQIFVREIGEQGAGAAVPLPSGGGSASYPSIDALGPDKLLVTWTETTADGNAALAARGRIRAAGAP